MFRPTPTPVHRAPATVAWWYQPDLKLIERFVTPGRTPFVIATSIDWVDPDTAGKMRRAAHRRRTLAQRLAGPRHAALPAALRQQLHQRYATSGGMARAKAAVNAAKTWAKIELANLSAVQYPGEKDLLSSADQNYQSSNLSGQTRKRQLWQHIDGRWQIIYEGSA